MDDHDVDRPHGRRDRQAYAEADRNQGPVEHTQSPE
jgi:hypothetical protein